MRPLNFLTTIIFITLFITNVCSQPTVYEHSIKFENSTTATLVGEDGIIMKTTDNGNTWVEQTSGVVNTLYGNAIIDAEISLAVGENGVILKTTDGGESWAIVTSSVSTHLRDVVKVGTQNAVICGDAGVILYSTDNGDTWASVTSNTENDLNDIVFADENVGFIIGDLSSFLKTTDGGSTWSIIDMQFGYRNFNAIAARSENELIIVGEYGAIFISTDGGTSWFTTSLAFEYDFNDVVLFGQEGIIVGNEGSILNTTDGGMTWNLTIAPSLPNISTDFMSVAFSSPATGIAIGENGTEIYTTDGGATWNNRPPELMLNGISERNAQELKNINNYPNPFNPSTTISFDIPKPGNVKVMVYDMTGKEVSRLFEGYVNSGNQKFPFNASDLSTGIYFYTITADGFKPVTQKMILIK